MFIPPVPTIEEIQIKLNRQNAELRDSFAKEIAKAIINSDKELTPKEIAEKTYCIAEEMLTARKNYL